MTEVAIYVRQSVSDLAGIDRQKQRCIALAAQRGWTVVEVFEDDDVSAVKPRGAGTAWHRLLRGAGSRYTAVVAVDVDRLLRSTRDLVSLMDSGLKVVTVDGEIDTSTADGEFRATMLAGIARFETQRKHERMTRADDARAAQGLPRSGIRPYGWSSDRVSLDEEEAHWVRKMTEWCIEGRSLHSIARTLNEEGVPARKEGLWTTRQVRAILLRPRNAGLLVRLGDIQPNSVITPVVSRADWDLCKAILDAKEGVGKRGPKPKGNWLSGIATCVCGYSMHVKHSWGKGANGTRTKVRTYICGDPHRSGIGHVSLTADIAEDTATRFMFGWMLGGPAEDAGSSEVRQIQETLAEVNEERSAATDALLTPGVDRVKVKARLADLEAQRLALESRLAEASADDSSLRSVLESMPHFDFTTEADYERFAAAWDAVDVEKRQALLRGQVTVRVLKGGKGGKRLQILPK